MANNNNKDKCNVPHLRFPEFSGEWKKCTIGELAIKVGSGVTPRGGESVYKTNGYPFVRSQNVGLGHLILDDIAFIDEETHLRQKSTELKLEDVLLNITGASIGRSALVNEQVVGGNVNQHVCIIRTKENLISSFLCNFLLSNYGQRQIDSFQAGGNRQGLNFEQIKSIKIAIPSTKEQTKVAKLLQLIEERIATQNKIIEDLKKLKCAIIESLLNSVRSNEMLLRDVGSYIRGLTYSSNDVVEQDGILVMRSNNIVNGSLLDYNNDVVFVRKQMSTEQQLQSGDIVICMANGSSSLVGKSSYYDGMCLSPITVGAFCGIYRSKEPIVKWLFQTSRYRRYILNSLQGGNGAIANLNGEDILRMSFPIPEKSTLNHSTKLLTSLDSLIESNISLCDLYSSQKKYMLRQMFI